MRTAGSRSMYFAMLIALGLPFAGAADSIGELDDATARIQYAFYTGDVRGIEAALALIERLELPESRKGMKEYFAAFGQWKLAELYDDEAAAGRRSARSNAIRAADACEDAAKQAMRSDPRSAEAHAIHAMCSALASRAPDVLSLGSCLRHRDLRTAREIDDANPRVRLIEVQCMFEGEPTPSADMLARVEEVVKAFDGARPVGPGWPDWGHAEALLLLGRLQLQQGDAIAARDSLERALVIAPDYRKAKELLQQATKSR